MTCQRKWKCFLLSFYFSQVILNLASVFHYTFLPDLCFLAIPAGELLAGTQKRESAQGSGTLSQSMQDVISPVASTHTYKPWVFMALLQLQVLRPLILLTGYSIAYFGKWKFTHVHRCLLRTESAALHLAVGLMRREVGCGDPGQASVRH